MGFKEYREKENLKKVILEICPSIRSIYEDNKDDPAQINIICREFNCLSDELLFTKEEYEFYLSSEYR